jgi:hypothetical protein
MVQSVQGLTAVGVVEDSGTDKRFPLVLWFLTGDGTTQPCVKWVQVREWWKYTSIPVYV